MTAERRTDPGISPPTRVSCPFAAVASSWLRVHHPGRVEAKELSMTDWNKLIFGVNTANQVGAELLS